MADERELLDRLIGENFAGVNLEEQRLEAAEKLGLDPESVEVRKDVLVTNLSREGVLVDLHIGRTRFTRRLDEADLGLNAEDERYREFLAEYVRLGEKHLLSLDYLRRLDRIESRARAAVEKYGFPTRWGTFVPYQNWGDMKAEVDACREEYFAVRDEILANYDALKLATEAAYREAAVQAYRHLAMDRNAKVPAEFAEMFVRAVMDHFPTPERVRASFYFDLDVGFVPLTSHLQEERARVALLEEKERLVRGRLAEEEMKLSEERRLREARERAELAIAEEEKRARVVAARYEQDRIREIHKEALETYRRGLDGFLADTLGRLRGMVYEACAAVRDHVERAGALGAGDVRRLKTLVERLERLNFTRDAEVEGYLAELRAVLDTPAERRNPEEVKAVLAEIAAQSRQVLALLGCEPRAVRSAAIEVAGVEVPQAVVARKPRPQAQQAALAFGEVPVRRRRAV
jgi:hypothetical protein